LTIDPLGPKLESLSVDTYDASAATTGCSINLDSVGHGVPANTAFGTDISGSAKDTITGFENANGGLGQDFIFGSAAGNTLKGNAGFDLLIGFGGKDTLDGGPGNDFLFGGAGKDQLTGGLDADTFAYNALSDSGITAATRDVIIDFQHGDVIDLHLIDANTKNGAGTNDAFTFVGTNIPTGFSGSPGELHAYWTLTGQIVEGDVNGDKKADFSIELQDPLHHILLTSTDFFL
jgi:Ca2+-binding RTX toxin-like protein